MKFTAIIAIIVGILSISAIVQGEPVGMCPDCACNPPPGCIQPANPKQCFVCKDY